MWKTWNENELGRGSQAPELARWAQNPLVPRHASDPPELEGKRLVLLKGAAFVLTFYAAIGN